MWSRRPARRRRSASMRRKSTRRSMPPEMAGSIFRVSSSTSENWRPSRTDMTTFQEARAFLLKHRADYDKAVADFRWPDAVPFNWALDWFEAGLARDPQSRDRPALWIVDAGSNRET